MADWRRICAVKDVEEGFPLGFNVEGKAIGIFRVGADIFALHDVCPHEYALLSSGFQDGGTIECPLHQALFNIRTGEHLAPPAECGVQSFPVKLQGEDVLVDIAAR
jgi:3-phenylpropionate/trans-cinnamate dioxygenase ferredoxin subunit